MRSSGEPAAIEKGKRPRLRAFGTGIRRRFQCHITLKFHTKTVFPLNPVISKKRPPGQATLFLQQLVGEGAQGLLEGIGHVKMDRLRRTLEHRQPAQDGDFVVADEAGLLSEHDKIVGFHLYREAFEYATEGGLNDA